MELGRIVTALPSKLIIMARVKVIASTVRYGSNGFKHAGDEYNLPDEVAKEKAAAGLVRIISLDNKSNPKKTKAKATPVVPEAKEPKEESKAE
jgi:hypothetical protein